MTPRGVGSETGGMNFKEALPMAEIMLGSTAIGSPREGNKLAVTAPPAGMTVALAPILLPSRRLPEKPESRMGNQIDGDPPSRISERAEGQPSSHSW